MPFLFFLSLIALFARENPFEQEIKNDKLQITTNKVKKQPQLKSQDFNISDGSRILKNVTFEIVTVEGDEIEQTFPVNKSVLRNLPLTLSQKTPSKKDRAQKGQMLNFKFAKLILTNDLILLHIKDPLKRHFLLKDPYKIVLDFDSDRDLKYFKKRISLRNIKDLTMAKHTKYYRLSISLNGHFLYRLQDNINTKNEVRIELE